MPRKRTSRCRHADVDARRPRACISDDKLAMKVLRSIADKFIDTSSRNHNLKEIWESGGCGSITVFERAIHELDAILAKARGEPPLLRKLLFAPTLGEVQHLRRACDQAIGLMLRG